MQSSELKLGTEGAIIKLRGNQATKLMPQSREAVISHLKAAKRRPHTSNLSCPNILLYELLELSRNRLLMVPVSA